MLVIYYCYGGTHSSPLHSPSAFSRSCPNPKGIASTAVVRRIQTDPGQLFSWRPSRQCHLHLRQGKGEGRYSGRRAGFLSGGDSQELFFVDTMPAVNLVMRVGGYLSRRLGRFGPAAGDLRAQWPFHSCSQVCRHEGSQIWEASPGEKGNGLSIAN